MTRIAAWAVTAALAAAVLSPVTRPVGWDSFPVSSYPMFSRADLGTVVTLSHAVLVDEAGSRRPASPSLVGTPEVMVAKAIVERAIARGGAEALCARIAARARDAVDAARTVEIVTSEFDSRRYFDASDREGRLPIRRTVHATCGVPR